MLKQMSFSLALGRSRFTIGNYSSLCMKIQKTFLGSNQQGGVETPSCMIAYEKVYLSYRY